MALHQSNMSRLPSDKKLRELIVFVSERSEGDAPFGSTKLNKLLFFADFVAYRKLGKAITWQKYQKLENGPCPRRMFPALRQLEQDDAVVIAERDYHGKTQKRTIALREPDLSEFCAEEIALVTEIIDEFWGKNAKQISEASHEFIGWQLADIGEDIPYEVALARFADQRSSPKISKKLKSQLLKLDAELRAS